MNDTATGQSLANARKRGFQEKSWAGENPQWARAHGVSPYDCSADSSANT